MTLGVWPLAVAIALTSVLPGMGQAQSGAELLFEECSAGAEPGLAARCADAALALHALQGGVGLVLTAGGALPASPSTAGRRLATQPRVVLDGGLAWASVRHPDLSVPLTSSGPSDQRTLIFGARGTAVVGVFEGFSPFPGAGGVFSLDAVGTLHLLRVDGLDGAAESIIGWGGGGRLGILRESFSLPGVTLSAMYYQTGSLNYGTTGPSGALIRMRPRATSIRATVGKDLLAVGISAGAGWDEYNTSGRIEAQLPLTVPPGPQLFGEGGGGPVDSVVRRHYVFGGANLTWLVAQLAGELAWVSGGSPAPPLEGNGPYRPGGMELQGALTLRITY